MILNRDSLLEMFKAKTVTVDIEPGQSVTLRELTVRQIEQAREEQKTAEADKQKPAAPFGLRLLSWSLADAEGNRMLESADIEQLQQSGNQHIEHLVGKVLELNGFLKVPEKNSEATKTVASNAD